MLLPLPPLSADAVASRGTFRRAAASRSKRAFDVAAATVLLVVTAPLTASIVILIRATSRGPIIYRQERIGLAGTPFTLYKFRTMQAGAPVEVHEQFVAAMISTSAIAESPGIYKLQGDPRITRIGKWLRRMSLDELPQLVNVLRGQMSLIGPRPPLAYEVARYAPWQHERLSVRPGITGLWQVSGRNRLTYAQMCAVDIEYIRGWSFRRDLSIALRTPWAMFVDRGGAE
ncbi:MAG TPA: sugar transferase [Candidatus Limnocylindria bacterium]|jgi:lipopolysaccharide/colanic/teichoic acid biosynthesis glycosyltransferase